MSWLGGIGAGLSVLGNEMSKREEQKRSQEERMKSIRDKLSLVNAQAPEKKRVIPGQELPADVAGPPAPEMVETFKTNLKYDPEQGYVAEDQVLGSERNQWSKTDQTAKEAGGKVIKKTTEMDLAGNQRMNFDEEDAAQKLSKVRIRQGGDEVDAMIDPSGKIVSELGRGPRRTGGEGRSPEEMRADADYRHNLTMERERKRRELERESLTAKTSAAAIGEWRELNDRQKEAYNEGLGLSPTASVQEVRTAIRKRINEDLSAPTPDEPKALITQKQVKATVDDRDGTVDPFKKPKEDKAEKADKPKTIDSAARKMINAAKEAGASDEDIKAALEEDGYDLGSL